MGGDERAHVRLEQIGAHAGDVTWPSMAEPSFLDCETASVAAAMSEPTYDSNRSAPMPATSPTLSPTLSAMTAGLWGSSSSMPASTLPTRSAPTSAALV